MKTCKICSGSWPTLEGHHVIPREFNGEHGPIVDICANCHSGLHSQAKHWASGRDEFQFFPASVMERARPFIQAIMQAQLAHEARSPSDKRPPKLLSIKLQDPEVLKKLHLLKRDRGYRSLEKFLNDLLGKLVSHL